MNHLCFTLSGIIVFSLIILLFINIIIARYAILEINEKISNSFLKIFPNSQDRFPFNSRHMKIKTQFKLYYILLVNQNNIKNIVGIKQIWFLRIFICICCLILLLFFCIANIIL
jgi:hypothetical protein